MDRKILSWVASFSLIALALAILLPGGREADPKPKLPWDIKVDLQGGSEIFGLALGKSTLEDARKVFNRDGKISLFITHEGQPALEAYFERVFLSGLRADFILVLDADTVTLQGLYDRGSRISRTTEITQKVELTVEDEAFASHLPIKLINYIPAADLDDALITKRFGAPAERITESETGIVHWIYPETGLSIAVNPQGKELLQYIQPREADILIDSLRSSGVEKRN